MAPTGRARGGRAAPPLLRAQTVAALAAFLLLAGLSWATGLGAAGWTAGSLCIVGTWTAYTAAQRRRRAGPAGPADAVTLARVGLIAGVAALVGDGLFGGDVPNVLLAGLAAVALVLDAVDGAVARRTRTASALGARFDMEADALLLLVLSVHAALSVLGAWVLAIGAMRYAFAAAGRLVPRLREPLPPSDARRAVAALQGIALVAAAPDLLPVPAVTAATGGALALLVWSFGRDTLRLLRTGRSEAPVGQAGRAGEVHDAEPSKAPTSGAAGARSRGVGARLDRTLGHPERPCRLSPGRRRG
ncbi:CDP-alcohol phosphatidyltransferase family protein [Streptomonospora wellingtoniae]|uniref:CDP-alcohol phosphatidyltransferase family protein n=1 Tax=Streptomonospora wellingtoniae TaxID=3075544 RepID=A0ABU2KRJ6_9ACTN|nr:CDP-alcohol phosphatidyltransferase family protein [Streptomonospora sp. DSM 45055]MDT0301841.1 CDP-alcohol phosphatidyltransferase family protein [Streptomonospora sp. DSM 45055]